MSELWWKLSCFVSCLTYFNHSSSAPSSSQSSSSNKNKIENAPVVPFGLDLYYWGEEQPNNGKIVKYDSWALSLIYLITYNDSIYTVICFIYIYKCIYVKIHQGSALWLRWLILVLLHAGCPLSISSGLMCQWRRRWKTRSSWQKAEVDIYPSQGASLPSAISVGLGWIMGFCVRDRTASR